jgi:hypothetical protein
MLYLLVACAAAQLGGEETDGFSSPDALPDTGSEASATDPETGMSSPSTRDAGETPRGEDIDVLGMVGGVAVTDYGVMAIDCTELDFSAATDEVDTPRHRLLITYGLTTPGSAPQPCVVSWTYFGMEPGEWTLDIDGRTATFDVL